MDHGPQHELYPCRRSVLVLTSVHWIYYRSTYYMAESQFLYSFENNINSLMFLLTSTNLGVKFAQTPLSHSIFVLSILIGRPSLLSFLTTELYEEPELCNLISVQYCSTGIWVLS